MDGSRGVKVVATGSDTSSWEKGLVCVGQAVSDGTGYGLCRGLSRAEGFKRGGCRETETEEESAGAP